MAEGAQKKLPYRPPARRNKRVPAATPLIADPFTVPPVLSPTCFCRMGSGAAAEIYYLK
jgi:hypothetical protein